MERGPRALDFVLPQDMLFRQSILNQFYSPFAEIEQSGNANSVEFTDDEIICSGISVYLPHLSEEWLEIATAYGEELAERDEERIYTDPHVESFEKMFLPGRDEPLSVVYLSRDDALRNTIRGKMFACALERKEKETLFLVLGSILQNPRSKEYGVLSFHITVLAGACFEEEDVVPLREVNALIAQGAYVLVVAR